MESIAVLERRQRLSMIVNIVLVILLVLTAGEFARDVHAQQKQDNKTLVLSELTISIAMASFVLDSAEIFPTLTRKSHAGAALLACSFMTRQVRNEVGTSLSNQGATWG
jgi:hypothetical protein